MKVSALLLLILCVGFSKIEASKILAIVPTPSYSHQVALWPIWEELSQRGHHVTLVTTNPRKEQTNITQIDTSSLYKSNVFNMNEASKLHKSPIGMMQFMTQIFTETQENTLSITEYQDLIKDTKLSFDVVLVESWTNIFYAFAYKFKAPLISVSSCDVFPALYETMGVPNHPILYPMHVETMYDKLDFSGRLKNALAYVVLKLWFAYVLPLQDAIIHKHFGSDYPSSTVLIESVELLLLNNNAVYHEPRPLVPSVVNFGGDAHISKPIPLPKVSTYIQ